MAITKTFNSAAPAGSDNISVGDDQIRNDKAGTIERFENAGQYFPDNSADSKSGLHYPGDSNQVAGEFVVYDGTGSPTVPDTTIKRIRIVKGVTGNTEVRAGATSGNVQLVPGSSGVAQVNSDTILTGVSVKRILVLSTTGNWNISGSDRPVINADPALVVPNYIGASAGTLREFGITCLSNPFTAGATVALRQRAGSAWAANVITSDLASGASTLGTITVSGSITRAQRMTSGFSATAVSGGDVFMFAITGMGAGLYGTAYLVIDILGQ